MASSLFALFISMLLLGGVTCYGPEVGRKMLVENFNIPSTPTSKDGTGNFMSVIPSTPTSKDETRDFMSVIPSTPTSKDETRDFMSVIPSTQSRKILRHRRLIGAKGSISPTAPGN